MEDIGKPAEGVGGKHIADGQDGGRRRINFDSPRKSIINQYS
jgi:hypothetical protein